MNKHNCEACGINTNCILQVRPKEVYKICLNCLSDLVNVRLSPEQFFSLIKNKHNATEFYLHDDFYDSETGEGLQPQ